MRVGAQRLQAVELKTVLTFPATVRKTVAFLLFVGNLRLSVIGVLTHVERFH